MISAPLLAVTSFTLLAAADPVVTTKQTELNFVPVVGGDSDIGLGLGGVGDLARLQPDYSPFRWRLEAAAFISFKPGVDGNRFTIPFQDYYLLLSVPQLTDSRRLRVELRPSFTNESIQRFFGVGNASPEPPPGVAFRQTRYGRLRFTVLLAARVTLLEHLFVRPAIDYTRNWLDVPDDSILVQQRTTGSDKVRALLDGPLDHSVAAGELALIYDSRDNETVTRHGSFHHLRYRYSPRFGSHQPFRFGEVNATARLYRSPLPWLQLAGRLVGDLLFGDPPFYELTRVEDTSVVGGGKGIRGVPGQRYYGKVKVYGTVEARTEVWRFQIRNKPFVLATAAFFDGGRVWSDLNPSPELDGTGLGLKYGVGGGLRLQEGTTFVVRADIAWSPDARPIGAYFNAGQTF